MSGLYNTTLSVLSINGTNIELNGGVRNTDFDSGGGISISPGDGVGSDMGKGGACTILGGTGDGDGGGGLISISGGTSGNDVFADGGILILSGGNSVGTFGVGGDIKLITGSGDTNGKLQFFIGGDGTGATRYIWPTASPTVGQALISSTVVGTNPIVSTMTWANPGYASARLTNNLTTNPIKDIVWDAGIKTSIIALNTSTGIFTLTASRNYLLTTTIRFFGGTGAGNFGVAWVDTSNVILTPFVQVIGYTSSSGDVQTITCTGIYTPSADIGVKVRITLAGNAGTQTITDNGTSVVITEL